MAEMTELRDRLRELSTLDLKKVTLESAETLNQDDKQEIAKALNGPTQPVTNFIWLLVVAAFAVVLVGSFTALAIYSYSDKPAQMLLTVFMTVAAFLGGLLAPSPVSSGTK